MTASSYKDLENDGQIIVNQIKQYRLDHGNYPESLKSANIINKSYRYGNWKYEILKDDNNFTLSIGNYAKDHFFLSWNNTDGYWYLDR